MALFFTSTDVLFLMKSQLVSIRLPLRIQLGYILVSHAAKLESGISIPFGNATLVAVLVTTAGL